MKVLWLHHRIAASVVINALLIISVDGFKRIRNYHAQYHAIKAGLVAEVCACAKKRVEERLGDMEHRDTAKRNREIRHNRAKNRRANHKNFHMFRNTTIAEFKSTIT